MKKILALAVLAVITFSASAQKMWMASEMSINTESIDEVDKTAKEFTFSPELGYRFNNRWAMAVALSYSHYNDEIISNAFSVNPFIRYTCAKVGNFSFFIDGGMEYGLLHINGIDDNSNRLKFGINPGLSFCITKSMGLVTHIGELSYTHAWMDDSSSDNFHFSMTKNISLGVYYNF